MYQDFSSFAICAAMSLFHHRKLATGGICPYDKMTFCPSGQCLGCYPDENGKLKSYCECHDSMDCPVDECCSFMFNVCGNIHTNYCPHHFYSNVYEGEWCWFHESFASWDNISESHDPYMGCGGAGWGIQGVDWIPWGSVMRPENCGHLTYTYCKFCKGDMKFREKPSGQTYPAPNFCFDECCYDHPDWGICPACPNHPNCPENM